MGKTVISFGLSVKEINRAIREVEKFKRDFERKVEEYRRKVAEAISNDAQLGFNGAVLSDVIKGSTRQPEVTVSVEERGDITVVVANGEDAVWVEFGAGVHHNGSVGSSPNPYGGELGFTIGSYGKGYGKAQAWGYYDENHNLVLTRGTPAAMPMYNAAEAVAKEAIKIAREVFV